MENIAHTLIGVTLGRTLQRTRLASAKSARFTKALFWTAVIGNNLPDSDFVLPPIVGGGNVGYLLHHRGHTHTLIWAPVLALLGVALTGWITRYTTRLAKEGAAPLSRREWILLYAITVGSTALHILADSWNEYGVHPFWPFNSNWFYGDFIFIVEPMFWGAMMPLAILSATHTASRAIWMVLGLIMLGLLWSGLFMPWTWALLITGWAALFAILQTRFKRNPAPAWAGLLMTLAIFAWNGSQARQHLHQAHQAHTAKSSESISDLILSPAPGNPWCWRMIQIGLRDGSNASAPTYYGRMGTLSLAPSFVDPKSCFFRMQERSGSAPFHESQQPSTDQIRWVGEFSAPLSEFNDLRDKSCTFRDILGFVRAPFWVEMGKDRWLVGDLRYDHREGVDFAEALFRLGEERCVRWVPSWNPPTQKLNR